MPDYIPNGPRNLILYPDSLPLLTIQSLHSTSPQPTFRHSPNPTYLLGYLSGIHPSSIGHRPYYFNSDNLQRVIFEQKLWVIRIYYSKFHLNCYCWTMGKFYIRIYVYSMVYEIFFLNNGHHL